MSMLTGQCKRLRDTAEHLREHFGAVSRDPTLLDAVIQLEDAADTIEHLRTDCQEWHRVAESKQDIIDHMRDAQKENQKLRDLVQMMYACKGECDECQWLNDGYACGYFMEELGIEVDG